MGAANLATAMKPTPFALALLAFMNLSAPLAAQLRLPPLLGEGAVLQRRAAVPIWGWAAPGSGVTVAFGGQAHSTRADAEGAWQVLLPPMEAGGPHTLTVEAGGERIERRDVLVGDVWVASGQSNMEWVLNDAAGGTAAAAAADDPHLRHFKVPRAFASTPQPVLPGGAWEKADADHAGGFSAVGYHFARTLREHHDVPIGLLHASWGGSRIEAWMPGAAQGLGPEALARVLAADAEKEQQVLEALRARVGGPLPTTDEGLVDGVAHWADPDLDIAAWTTIPVPALWEDAGYPGMDGVAWYRTTFTLTAEEARQGATLGLAYVDDSDRAYVNGQEVGGLTNAWNQVRRYQLPPATLRAGVNVLAVRVDDSGGGGGIYGDAEGLFVEAGGQRQLLAGEWLFRVGKVLPITSARHHMPTLLYNAMVYPAHRFPIAGVIWYQGESNADTPEDAVAYRTLLPGLIRAWRAAWGQPDLPFLWAQLANFHAADAQPPATSNWALVRESMTETLRLPHTAQAVLIDVGDAGDIHPRDKQTVGERLALAARHVAYGESVVFSGPVYSSHAVEGHQVRVRFQHVGGGLMARGGNAVSGFALAGEDGVWHWAEGRIEADAVVVESPQVSQPVAVRYAWADNPDRANLYNAEGLPAIPFRTDAPGRFGAH